MSDAVLSQSSLMASQQLRDRESEGKELPGLQAWQGGVGGCFGLSGGARAAGSACGWRAAPWVLLSVGAWAGGSGGLGFGGSSTGDPALQATAAPWPDPRAGAP